MLAVYQLSDPLGAWSATHRQKSAQLAAEAMDWIGQARRADACALAVRHLQQASYALGGSAAHALAIYWGTQRAKAMADVQRVQVELGAAWRSLQERCKLG